MPSFFAWLFRPAFKDNKVISSFSTFLRLLLSFFDIPRILSRFSESLAALRIASLVSASLLLFFLSSLFLSSFTPSHLLFLISPSLSLLSHIFFFIFSCSLVLSCYLVLYIVFSSSLVLLLVDIPCILPLFSAPLFFFSFLISEPLGVLRIASLVSASLLFSFFFLYSLFRSSLVSYSPFFSCSLFLLLVT